MNALFLADNYMNWLEQGVSNVDWWDLHNGIVTQTNDSSSLYGNYTYGDYGLFSYGATSGSLSEPPNETPFPAYYGMQMLTYLGAAGDQMVSASSNTNMIAVHAVRQASGNLALLLINEDPANSYPVSITINGYSPASAATVYAYGENSTSVTSSTIGNAGSSFTQTVPPYSLTTLVLTPSGSGTPPPVVTATETPAPGVSATATPGTLATATPGTSAPAFTSAVTTSAPSVVAGASILIQASVTNTGGSLPNGLVDLEIFNSANTKVGQQYFDNQSLAAGQSSTYNMQWTAPSQSDTYQVRLGVFGSGWSPSTTGRTRRRR